MNVCLYLRLNQIKDNVTVIKQKAAAVVITFYFFSLSK